MRPMGRNHLSLPRAGASPYELWLRGGADGRLSLSYRLNPAYGRRYLTWSSGGTPPPTQEGDPMSRQEIDGRWLALSGAVAAKAVSGGRPEEIRAAMAATEAARQAAGRGNDEAAVVAIEWGWEALERA